MYSDTIVVITGQLNSMFVDNLIKSYVGIYHKLVSTWNDQDKYLLELLRLNNFKIVLSDYPEHKNSANVQIHATRMGALEAQRLGYRYVCHTRTDVFPLNYNKFLYSCADLYSEKLTILRYIQCVYFLQILTIGPVDEILRFYNTLQEPSDTRFPEKYLMETYIGSRDLTKEDIKSHFNICLDICRRDDIEFIWVRPESWANGCTTIPMMKVIAEYSKDAEV